MGMGNRPIKSSGMVKDSKYKFSYSCINKSNNKKHTLSAKWAKIF